MQRWYQQKQETANKVTGKRHGDKQSANQGTLSAQEIETIATEAGIEPQFIRQTLTVAEAEAKVANISKIKKRPRHRLSNRTKFLMFGVPILSSVFCAASYLIIVNCLHRDSFGCATVFVFFLLPALVTIVLGAKLRRIFQGTLAGCLIGMGSIVAMCLVMITTPTFFRNLDGTNNIAWEFIPIWGITGALLGCFTNFLRRNLPRWIPDVAVIGSQTQAEHQGVNTISCLHYRISAKTKFFAFWLPLLHLLFYYFVFTMLEVERQSVISFLNSFLPEPLHQPFILFLLPGLMTIISATNLRPILQGTVAGSLIGLGTFLPIYLVAFATDHPSYHQDFNIFWVYFFGYVIGGTALGELTTYLRWKIPGWIARRKQNKTPVC